MVNGHVNYLFKVCHTATVRLMQPSAAIGTALTSANRKAHLPSGGAVSTVQIELSYGTIQFST
jgi:hypothetical protein